VQRKLNAPLKPPLDNVRQKKLDAVQKSNVEPKKKLDNVRQKRPLDAKQKKPDAKPN
jgi:hypothetical protein